MNGGIRWVALMEGRESVNGGDMTGQRLAGRGL